MHIAGITMNSHTDLSEEPSVPPSGFFALMDEGMHGIIRAAALAAASDLSLFDHLQKPHEIAHIASLTGVSEEMLKPLLLILIDMGLIESEGRSYRTTTLSDVYLCSSSPFSQRSYVRKNARFMKDIWCRMGSIVSSGPVLYTREEFFGRIALPAMAENARCGRLQKTIKEILSIPGFSGFGKMVDLGGGHGLYAIALAQENPLMETYVFDLPHIIPLAEEYIKKFGITRVHTIAGDFFRDDFGSGYDIILSSSSPSGKSTEILPRIAGALKSGGYFVNVQSVGREEKDIYQALEWQMWTIEGMKKGTGGYVKERPFMTPEYRHEMTSAGLRICREQEIEDDYHEGSKVRLVIAEKI